MTFCFVLFFKKGRYGSKKAEESQTCEGNCTAGYFGTGGSKSATCDGPCPPGTYSAAGASKCIACEAGKTSTQKSAQGVTRGATECTSCDPGKYAVSGAASCLLCPVGKKSSATKAFTSSNCGDDCEVGFYRDEGHACKPCAAGVHQFSCTYVYTTLINS